jgi:tRNA(fMet)-specific endonuclease VapC
VKFLLDTNAVIALFKGGEVFASRLRQHQPEDFGLSAIVMHELFYGASKSRRAAENLARIEALRFAVLEFDREDARKAGEIRAMLAGQGTPIGPYDVLIAGQAVARGLTLITHNIGEFRRIPQLKLEDWEA